MNDTTRIASLARAVLLGVAAALLVGCGGGGGGGGGSPPPAGGDPGGGAPATKPVSGSAHLGIIRGARVTVSGTGGQLGSGVTGQDGKFGPIQIAAAYSGPLLVEVAPAPDGSSTWVCDLFAGCADGRGGTVAFGATLPFTTPLKAIVPSIASSATVHVSMLTHLAAARVEALGPLTSASVVEANATVAAFLRSILTSTLVARGLTVPDDFAGIELVDLRSPSLPATGSGALTAVLSLLNSSMLGLMPQGSTYEDFVAHLPSVLVEHGSVPNGVRFPHLLNQDAALIAFFLQVDGIRIDNGAPAIALGSALAPITLSELASAALATRAALPALTTPDLASVSAPWPVSLITSQAFPRRVFPIQAGSGVLPPAASLVVSLNVPWATARVIDVSGAAAAAVEIVYHPAALAVLPSGISQAPLVVSSTTGQYRALSTVLRIQNDLATLVTSAGPDLTGLERSTATLQAVTSGPSPIATVAWTQTAGPPAQIVSPGTLVTPLVLPSVTEQQTLTFTLSVTDTSGRVATDTVNVHVQAYLNVTDLALPDPALQQCALQAAASNDYEELSEFTALACQNVADIAGLDAFPNLAQLGLAGGTFRSLAPLLSLTSLESVDLIGVVDLPCAELDALIDANPSVVVSAEDVCRGAVMIDLGANAFDSAHDVARQQVYVSLPSRNEIAVLSLPSLRVVDRILLGGSPHGLDLSIDGTRLFAALRGSNAVAEVDLATRDARLLDLGVASDHSLTWDVAEVQQDRLFVTSNPSSGGFAYVVQLRLDQGDTPSRVASQRIIRASPVIAVSPARDFAYVGEGFSPNSLYKLSLADPSAAIVLEDDHGAVSGTDNLVLNASGTRIALSSGQVLRTGSFIEEGRIPAGYGAHAAATNALAINISGSTVDFYDFDTLQRTRSVATHCALPGTARRLHPFNTDEDLVLIRDDRACIVTDVSRTTPADPFPELHFSDLALENCVRTVAQATGSSSPEDFLVLDCSGSAQVIRSLDGLQAMVNLQHLDISGSRAFDLTPLAGIATLQSVTAQNSALQDVAALLGMTALSSLDVVGNPAIACAQLDQLAAGGVAVQADLCSETFRVELGGLASDLELDLDDNRAFVSVPSLGAVREIDLASFSVARTLPTTGAPQGIDLSADGGTLYAALNGLGSVAYLDTSTGAREIVDIRTLLDHGATYDVIEVTPNRVLVSASPSSSGFAYVVLVQRDLGNAALRVASQRIIRAEPIFGATANGSSVYVGEGFSPNSLYRLDGTQPTMPIVAEDDHGAVHGTDFFSVSSSGSRIYTASGQIVNGSTIIPVGQLPPGRNVLSADDATIYIVDSTKPGTVGAYDTATLRKTGQRGFGCTLQTVARLGVLGNGIVALGDDLFCGSRTVAY